MPSGKKPVGHGEPQVVLVEFHERRLELLGASERAGEGVGLELEAARQPGHAEGEDFVVGAEDELEHDDEADERWHRVVEAESGEKFATSVKKPENEERKQEVGLADEHILQVVTQFPMS